MTSPPAVSLHALRERLDALHKETDRALDIDKLGDWRVEIFSAWPTISAALKAVESPSDASRPGRDSARETKDGSASDPNAPSPAPTIMCSDCGTITDTHALDCQHHPQQRESGPSVELPSYSAVVIAANYPTRRDDILSGPYTPVYLAEAALQRAREEIGRLTQDSYHDAHCIQAMIIRGNNARIAELEGQLAVLDTPHTADWFEGVRLEAAHQIKRWGADHDAGKEPQDWFWLLGYLSGKALRAAIDCDAEKTKHHTISSGAVLLNWFRAITGDSNAMRPGIDAAQADANGLAPKT